MAVLAKFIRGDTTPTEVCAGIEGVDRRRLLSQPLASIYDHLRLMLEIGWAYVAEGRVDVESMRWYARLFEFTLERAVRGELWRVGDEIPLAQGGQVVVESDREERVVTVSSPRLGKLTFTRRMAGIPAGRVSEGAYVLATGAAVTWLRDPYALEADDGTTNMDFAISDVLEIRAHGDERWRFSPQGALWLGDALRYHADLL